MASASCVGEVMVSMLVVVAVAEEVEKLNRKLFDRVVATLEDAPARVQTLRWPMTLAVSVQMVLVEARSPVAEVLGRTIDAALSGGADGRSFKPCATHPLQAECIPPRPTLLSRSPGTTCCKPGTPSASAAGQLAQPGVPAKPAPSASALPCNLSLSSAWAAVAMLLSRAAWWHSHGRMAGSCAAPAVQKSQPVVSASSVPFSSQGPRFGENCATLLGGAVGAMLWSALCLWTSHRSVRAQLWCSLTRCRWFNLF